MMTNKQLADAFRSLARDFETGAEQRHSCNAVERRIGRPEKLAYEEAYGFDFDHEGKNQGDLWDDDEYLTDRRVLMLCFAAAMAETGDLT